MYSIRVCAIGTEQRGSTFVFHNWGVTGLLFKNSPHGTYDPNSGLWGYFEEPPFLLESMGCFDIWIGPHFHLALCIIMKDRFDVQFWFTDEFPGTWNTFMDDHYLRLSYLLHPSILRSLDNESISICSSSPRQRDPALKTTLNPQCIQTQIRHSVANFRRASRPKEMPKDSGPGSSSAELPPPRWDLPPKESNYCIKKNENKKSRAGSV